MMPYQKAFLTNARRLSSTVEPVRLGRSHIYRYAKAQLLYFPWYNTMRRQKISGLYIIAMNWKNS